MCVCVVRVSVCVCVCVRVCVRVCVCVCVTCTCVLLCACLSKLVAQANGMGQINQDDKDDKYDFEVALVPWSEQL